MGVIDRLFKDTTFGVGGGHYVYYQRGISSKGENGVAVKQRNSINKLLQNANVKSLGNKYYKDMKRMSLGGEGLAEKLYTMAEQEREKENLVLRKLDPNKRARYSQMGDAKFINKLNEFLGMGQQYKMYLKYLKEVYPNTQAKNLSPMVTSYFNQYFAQILSSDEFIDGLAKRVKKVIMENGTQAQIDAACQDISDWVTNKFMDNGANNRFFDEFIKKVEGTNKTLDEQYMFWYDLFEKIRADDAVRNEFMSSVLQSYGLKTLISNAIKGINEQKEAKGKVKGTEIKQQITASLRSSSYGKGGLFYEAVAVALQALNLQSLGNGNTYGSSKISNGATTDTVALYTGELTLEIRKELETKFEELMTKPLADKHAAIEAVKSFTEWVQENVDSSILVYGNAKSYKLSNLSTGKKFFHGGRRDLSNLGDLIVLDGGTLENANSFIDLIINTIPGAIYAGKQDAIKNQLSVILAQNIAQLLFDDWETIGFKNEMVIADSNKLVIHVFPLNGVLVPLSYFLNKAAQAFEKTSVDMVLNSNNYFRISFDLPKNIHFEDPAKTTAFINNYQKEHLPQGVLVDYEMIREVREQGLVEAWKLQSKEAMKSKFGVDFLSNFNDLLKELNQFMV